MLRETERRLRGSGLLVLDVGREGPRLGKCPNCRVAPALSAQAKAIMDGVGAQGEVKRQLEVRVPELIAYQDEACARRYADVVKRVVDTEARAVWGHGGPRRSGRALALQADGLQRRVRGCPAAHRPCLPGGGCRRSSRAASRVTYNLAPPLLAKRDRVTGELKKSQ
jgi:indolepyruvate ferredoxin oxidoreductase